MEATEAFLSTTAGGIVPVTRATIGRWATVRPD